MQEEKKLHEGELTKKIRGSKAFFRNKNIYVVVLLASLPATVSVIAYSFYALGDSLISTEFIRLPGNLTRDETQSIITSVFFLTIFSIAILSGCNILTGIGTASRYSIAVGANRYDRAQKIIGNGVLLGLTLSIIVGISIIFWTPPLIRALRDLADPVTNSATDSSFELIVDESRRYITILGAGMILSVLSYLLPSLLRSEGHPIHSMIGVLGGAAINISFDFIFIVGLKTDIAGAAFATLIGYLFTISYSLSVFALYKHKHVLKGLISLKFIPSIYFEIASVGAGAFVRFIGEAIVPLLMAVVTIQFAIRASTTPFDNALFWSRVTGIVILFSSFFRRPAFGFIQGMRTVVGYFYGARDKDKLVKAVIFSFSLIFGVLVIFLIFAETLPAQLVSLYVTDNPEVAEYATRALRIASISIPIIAPVFLVLEFYQGTNRFIKNMLISSLRGVLVFIPVIFILQAIIRSSGYFDLIWYVFLITDSIAFLVVIPFAIVDFRKLKSGKYFEEDKHLARLKQ